MERYFITIKRGMNTLLFRVMTDATNLEEAQKMAQDLYKDRLHMSQAEYGKFTKATHVYIEKGDEKIAYSQISCLHVLDRWEYKGKTEYVNIF